jgi:hypothetical protein
MIRVADTNAYIEIDQEDELLSKCSTFYTEFISS